MSLNHPRCLSIVDIDDTLFRTSAKTLVKETESGQIVKKLSSSQMVSYKLPVGHEFDYQEYRDARLFAEESHAIDWMLNHTKILLQQIKLLPGSDMILLTARCDLDDKTLFLDVFRRHGFDIDSTYVERAGNLGKNSTAENKKVIVQKYIRQNRFESFRMFDDSKENLDKFLELKKLHPELNFYAYHVDELGKARKHAPLRNQPMDVLYEVTSFLNEWINSNSLASVTGLMHLVEAAISKSNDIRSSFDQIGEISQEIRP